MNIIRKVYIPSSAIVFSSSILFSSIYNIILGNNQSGYFYFVLQLMGLIIVNNVIDYGLGKINFRNDFLYYVVNFTLLYSFFLIIAYIFTWFHFTISHVITMSLAFMAIYCMVHMYFSRMRKHEADEINQLIAARNSLSNN